MRRLVRSLILPPGYVLKDQRLALSRGIVIHERCPVLEIVPGGTCTVRTERGTLRAEKVVLASNAWLSAIPELRRYLYVVASQVIATAEAPDLLNHIGWRDGALICDSQRQVLYYQRTPKGRVIFGRGSGEIAFRGDFGAGFNRSPQHGSGNVRELHRVYPSLRNVPAEYDWSGPIDCVPEHVPVFGHLTGHSNISSAWATTVPASPRRRSAAISSPALRWNSRIAGVQAAWSASSAGDRCRGSCSAISLPSWFAWQSGAGTTSRYATGNRTSLPG